MKRGAVFDKLNIIFRNNFDDESIVLTDETTAADIDDWDSLEQINLIVAIQNEFNVEFSIDEIAEMKRVGDMVSLILKKVNQCLLNT